jgi:hypothetical protein
MARTIIERRTKREAEGIRRLPASGRIARGATGRS